MQIEIVSEDEENYTVKITRPDGVALLVLIPKAGGDSYIDKELEGELRHHPFGLNFITNGHYY